MGLWMSNGISVLFFCFFAFQGVEYDRIYEGKFLAFYFVSLLECIKCVA